MPSAVVVQIAHHSVFSAVGHGSEVIGRRNAEARFHELLQKRFVRRLGSLGEVSVAGIEYNAFRGSRNLSRRPLKVTEYLFTVKRK